MTAVNKLSAHPIQHLTQSMPQWYNLISDHWVTVCMRKFAPHSETLTLFHTNGYVVIESFLSTSELEVLRQVQSILQGDSTAA